MSRIDPLPRERTPLIKLPTRRLEKPWGRDDLPAPFGNASGARIGEIWFEHPAGDAAPILFKLLFTSEQLSIQVHPGDDAAPALGLPRGKDECWLVLAADRGAKLGVGVKRACSVDELEAAALDGTIEQLVDWRAVRAGDFIYNPAGTVHALGAGLSILEVQQNVDVTYRLYDYGRPRPLHLAQALEVVRTKPYRDPRDRAVPAGGTVRLVDGPKFAVVRAQGPLTPGSVPGDAELTVFPLSAGCAVEGVGLRYGDCALAHGAGAVALDPGALALIAWAV